MNSEAYLKNENETRKFILLYNSHYNLFKFKIHRKFGKPIYVVKLYVVKYKYIQSPQLYGAVAFIKDIINFFEMYDPLPLFWTEIVQSLQKLHILCEIVVIFELK